MARKSDRSGAVGIVVMVVGVIFAVAGVVTYVVVSNELANENITVSKDAKYFAGKDVTGPFTAYSEAETISKHALKATGGKTYAELAKDDPLRRRRHAGVLPSGLACSPRWSPSASPRWRPCSGVVLVLIGWALRSLGTSGRGAGRRCASRSTASARA